MGTTHSRSAVRSKGAVLACLGLGSIGYLQSLTAAPIAEAHDHAAHSGEAHRHEDRSILILEHPYLTLEQYAAEATDVLHVRVASVQQRGNANMMPNKYVGLDVLDSLYGQNGPEAAVCFAGGSTAEGTLVVPSAPELNPGEEYLLFVTQVPGLDGHAVLGLSEGTYRVAKDVDGQDRAFGLHAPEGLDLAQFKAQVLDARMAAKTVKEVR